MSSVEATQISCPGCGSEFTDPSFDFCAKCGHSMNADASNPGNSPDPIRDARPETSAPSTLGRFKLPITGAVLIVISALLLFVPYFNEDGEQLSIIQGRDLCSSAFGSLLSDCSTISLIFYVSLFLVAVGLILVAAGLVRRDGSPTGHVDPAGGPPLAPKTAASMAAQPTGASIAAGSQAGSDSAGSASTAPALRPVALPITWPTTSTGWMVGVGSAVGAVSLLLPWIDGYGYFATWGLARPLNVLLMVALVGVAATVFLPDRVPNFALRRLGILVVTLVGLGIGFDQLGGSPALGSLLFLLGMLSAATGALIPEFPAAAGVPVTPDRIT